MLGFMSSFASIVLQPIGAAIAKGNYYAGVIFSAIIGGTVSVIGGGKFANGAVTSAFQFMYNDWLHNLSDAVAGFGDTVTFGVTGKVRDLLWGRDGYYLDDESGYYVAGEYSTMALGGARLTYAGLAKLLSISKISAKQAFRYRNLLKKIFRLNPFSKYRIYKYEDMLRKYGEIGLKSAAGRTYAPLNYLGGAGFFGGYIKPFEVFGSEK